MQLRSFILALGTALAIMTPVASAHIAPDPLNETSQPLSAVPHDYAGLDRRSTKVSIGAVSGPTSENSFGASLPQTRKVTTSTRNGTRRSSSRNNCAYLMGPICT
jgi:hypothetical protein